MPLLRRLLRRPLLPIGLTMKLLSNETKNVKLEAPATTLDVQRVRHCGNGGVRHCGTGAIRHCGTGAP